MSKLKKIKYQKSKVNKLSIWLEKFINSYTIQEKKQKEMKGEKWL